MPIQTNKKQSGKGGNFDTERNPFVGVRVLSNRPSLGDSARLGLVLDCVIAAGAAVMLGATRDGGALVITILDGDQRHRTYCTDEHELTSALASMEAAYEL